MRVRGPVAVESEAAGDCGAIPPLCPNGSICTSNILLCCRAVQIRHRAGRRLGCVSLSSLSTKQVLSALTRPSPVFQPVGKDLFASIAAAAGGVAADVVAKLVWEQLSSRSGTFDAQPGAASWLLAGNAANAKRAVTAVGIVVCGYPGSSSVGRTCDSVYRKKRGGINVNGAVLAEAVFKAVEFVAMPAELSTSCDSDARHHGQKETDIPLSRDVSAAAPSRPPRRSICATPIVLFGNSSRLPLSLPGFVVDSRSLIVRALLRLREAASDAATARASARRPS